MLKQPSGTVTMSKEFRAKADMIRDESTRDAYFKIAAAQEGMAANDDKMTASTVIAIAQKPAQ